MSKQTGDSRHITITRTGIATYLCLAVMMLLDSGVLLSTAPPAKADSEASSESGAFGRRGRRRYRMQQMQQQKMENQHERQVRHSTQKQDQYMRNLKPRQVIHNYHFPSGGQGQHAQNTSQGSAQTQSAPAPQTPSH